MSRPLRVAAVAAVAALSLSLVTPAQANTIGVVPGYGSVESSASGENAFFVANAPGKGFELFVTDGTNDGTRLVKDINPGSASAFEPRAYGGDNFARFTNVNGKTVFSAKDASGWQLWVTDGTSAGTKRLTSEAPTRKANAPIVGAVYNGEAYFSGRSDEFGIELWKTDGTAEGTVVAADVFPGQRSDGTNKSSYPLGFGVALGKLFFYSGSMSGSRILHSLDNEGTLTSLANLGTSGWDQILGAVEVDGKAVFKLGTKTWESDGTPEGTRVAATGKEIADGSTPVVFDGALFTTNWFSVSGYALELSKYSNGAVTRVTSQPVFNASVVGDKLFYFALDQDGLLALYTLASRDAAPVKVQTLAYNTLPESVYPTADVDGRAYFVADGWLWSSDATTAGTRKIQSVGVFEGDHEYMDLARAGDRLVIATWERLRAGSTEGLSRMWFSDGTSSGTYQALPARSFTTQPTPNIVGTAVEGATLRGGVGYWKPAPQLSYQWKANGVPIEGATGKTLVVPDLAHGTKLTFTVKASLPGYKSVTKSSAVKLVVRDFESTTVTVTGTKAAGEFLTADTSGWSPTATFTYQWFADGKPIYSASTSQSYKVSVTSQFKTIWVWVTGSLEGYRTKTVTSTLR